MTITAPSATLILVDIAEALALWVEQGGIAALTATDIEVIAADTGATSATVVAIAREAGVDIL